MPKFNRIFIKCYKEGPREAFCSEVNGRKLKIEADLQNCALRILLLRTCRDLSKMSQ